MMDELAKCAVVCELKASPARNGDVVEVVGSVVALWSKFNVSVLDIIYISRVK
jgi:hypothetical protein